MNSMSSCTSLTAGPSSALSNGLTLIVLSYERMKSLATLLESLLSQELQGVDLELILCNNSPRRVISRSRFDKVGRRLRGFTDLKILNSSHNWSDRLRWSVGTIAMHDTVLNLDDDIVLTDKSFLRNMLAHYSQLTPRDMLSCWNQIFVNWDDDDLFVASLNFLDPLATEMIQTDHVGTGICMYHKSILFTSLISRVTATPPVIGDYALPVLASMEVGTRCFFMPCHGMLAFHEESKEHSICRKPGFNKTAVAVLKGLINDGYRPVVSRDIPNVTDPASPEFKALQRLVARAHPRD